MKRSAIFIFISTLFLASCETPSSEEQVEEEQMDDVTTEYERDRIYPENTMVYEADIQPLNSSALGMNAMGRAQFLFMDDSVNIEIKMEGVAPGMMHLQHLHAPKDGSEAICPAATDNNNDGVIDLMETQETAGITMIPLHDDPSSMTIKTETYPKSDENGTYTYRATVSVRALKDGCKEKFGLSDPDMGNFVVMIHGAPEGKVPSTAASLPEVPAHVTIPIACGNVQLIKEQGQ